MRTSTPILISAMRILARDIVSDDGIANAAIMEGAERLEELAGQVTELRRDFRPWTKIDYSNPTTHPEENRPCLVAWDWDLGHPERKRMYEFNRGMWEISDDGDIKDWNDDEIDGRPTHWMYAPELKP